ncbi:MAG TPA: polysaccharide deacetylase family protein [Flavisolibacter sp.]|jgi:peptidoglycan/xylan/chitin deacetylase (PgdA/CDA1 family)|nr:polysaccharide deacetylase family protein [Flavisolibacter sp.]
MTYIQGAIVRGDSAQKEVALVFTADEFGEGLPTIIKTLRTENVKAGFFFTGRFYRNPSFREPIKMLQQEGHYLGPHSDKHLLYNDWTKRDSLLVSRDSFSVDLANNLATMKALSLPVFPAHLFIPPYEWWNDSIASWTMRAGLRLFSFTPGIRTAADYTYPEMGAPYKSSEWILNWLKDLLTNSPQKISGAIILIHAGTDPRRKDKLYDRLPEFIQLLKKRGYVFRRVDELIE